MRTLRYGADARWDFRGFDLPLTETVASALLTLSAGWADTDNGEEQPPAPPNELFVLTVTDTISAEGLISEPQDGEGNWAVYFTISAACTEEPVVPPPTFLWYEVTLLTDPSAFIFRPFVGQVRMLPDLYIPGGP